MSEPVRLMADGGAAYCRNATGHTAEDTGTRRQIGTGANLSGRSERHGGRLPSRFRRLCPNLSGGDWTAHRVRRDRNGERLPDRSPARLHPSQSGAPFRLANRPAADRDGERLRLLSVRQSVRRDRHRRRGEIGAGVNLSGKPERHGAPLPPRFRRLRPSPSGAPFRTANRPADRTRRAVAVALMADCPAADRDGARAGHFGGLWLCGFRWYLLRPYHR